MNGQASSFVHFPERADVLTKLLAMARREVPPGLVLMPVETGGGKTRLCTYLSEEAGLPSRAAIEFRIGRYGPEAVVNSILDALKVDRPCRMVAMNGYEFEEHENLPIEKGTLLLETALNAEAPGLLLVDDASGLMSQQSIAGRRAVQTLLSTLIKRFGISVAFLFCPDDDWPSLPGMSATSLMLGTIGASSQCRAWIDALQEGIEERFGPMAERLSDTDVLVRLIDENHGMVGFIEDDVQSLFVEPALRKARGEAVPSTLRECFNNPAFRRRYPGDGDFRGHVYASLRRAYERLA